MRVEEQGSNILAWDDSHERDEWVRKYGAIGYDLVIDGKKLYLGGNL